MSSKSWRGTVLFTVVLVTMGATVGLKLYGMGESVVGSPTSVHATTTTGSTAAGSTSSGSTATAPSATATPSPTASASTASATRTLTGSAVDTRYGTIQVRVTLTGGKITAVDELQSPNRDGRSVDINQQAAPMLEQEVLASQSANIDTVSGATYTSEGYIQSLQSALDQR